MHQYKKLKIWQDSVKFSITFKSFLVIAHGSGAEIETQLLISKELNFIKGEDYKNLISALDEIMSMLGSFIKNLSTS
jgi:four helix bundle protein